jgi:predicted SAM-dependent methyltransferase
MRQCVASKFGPVSLAAWNLFSEARIALIVISASRAFRRLRGKRQLKVHLGCGDDIREGWVNIDLDLKPRDYRTGSRQRQTILISYDLRLGLPLEESSCTYVYSSHLLEHLEPAAGLRVLRDCFTALVPGGVCRIAIPDYKRIFSAYIENDVGYFSTVDATGEVCKIEPETQTLVDQINYAVYQSGQHRCIYDGEKLLAILHHIGYRQSHISLFKTEIDHPSLLRRQYSLYVEATK